jgi:two-component system response regulator MprA
VEPATLEVHLSLLRKALGEPNPIQTVRGYGYRLFLP